MNDGMKYLYLPSNGSNEAFPGNTTGDWTTVLESPLDLSNGKYEVGLGEIQFIRSLPTITKLEFDVKQPSRQMPRKCTLRSSGVTSVQDFVAKINGAIPSQIRGSVKLMYLPHTFKVSILLADGYKIQIPNEWSNFLEFEKTSFNSGHHHANRIADLYQETYNLHVFSNISLPIPVGSKTKPLLGIVSIPKGHRDEPEVVIKNYENPMFIPINESYIQTIRIYLTDDIGNPVHFKLEPTTVKLVIRKAQ